MKHGVIVILAEIIHFETKSKNELGLKPSLHQ